MFKVAKGFVLLLVLTQAAMCLGNTYFTKSYEGHQVLRVVPRTRAQLDALNALETQEHSPEDYDFWKEPSRPDVEVDIRVAPGTIMHMTAFLHSLDLLPKVHISNLQEHFLAARRGSGLKATSWDTSYHNLNDINTWMAQIVANNSAWIKQVTVGTSYEGKPIYGLKMTKGTFGALPQMYLDGGIHAREWLAPATVQYLIGQFVNNATLYASYLNSYEWTFVPVFNPDGYEYTWNVDPNWRKNRQPNGASCVGTDNCRNAATGWGGEGSSGSACSDTYRGTAAWSAPEMSSWMKYIQTYTKLVAYVNFHSYAELWLDPWGWTAAKPADYNVQQSNGLNVTKAIQAVHGQVYGYGPAYTTIYPASGVPSDWIYDQLKVKLSQAVELRGNSFQPPPSIIVPTGEEILAGVLKLADDTKNV